MKIEILEMEETKARFLLRDASPAMANALRRTLLADIPKMAIDKVEFHLGSMMDDDNEKEYESTTPLFDEIIAHRLGMVPVPTDLDLFVPQDECVCGGVGCPSCQIVYSLNKHGPCTVYSRDLTPLGPPELAVKDENIPIVELTGGQAIMVYAYAVMGTGDKHVKWQVCNGVGYSYYPSIDVAGDLSEEDAAAAAAVCPRHVLTVVDGKLRVDDPPIECNLCEACVERTGGAISVSGSESDFVFKFETDGSLTADKALHMAVEILADEAREIKAQVEAL